MFLYDVVNRKALYHLSDEELENPETLKRIEKAAGKFRKDLDRVLVAMESVKDSAYKKFGEVFLQGIKGIDSRRRLLEALNSVVCEQRSPHEIRELAEAYEELIEGLQPVRKAICDFVGEYS